MQTRKSFHELNTKERKAYLEENILKYLPESGRAHGLTMALSIAHGYNGEANHALDILASSARKGEYHFNRFAKELHTHYLHSSQFDTPERRKEKLRKFLNDLDSQSGENVQRAVGVFY